MIDTWNSIITALEDEGSVASLVSIDFAKAFNRMDHAECIKSLTSLGASLLAADWVSSFLYGRVMSVRIRDTMSTPRPVPGGSPQGSILGIFLFCATTDQFSNIAAELPLGRNLGNVTVSLSMNGEAISISSGDGVDEEEQVEPPTSTPARLPLPIGAGRPVPLVGEEDDDSFSFDYFRTRRPNFLDSSDSDCSVYPTNESINRALGIDNHQTKKVVNYVYIDDYNAIEQVYIRNSKSHITAGKRHIQTHANQSEILFKEVQELAASIKMKVNESKTQLLCIHPFQNESVTSYIKTPDSVLKSGESLKILGFYFDRNPDASYHVKLLVNKFYGMLWSLRYLKRNGMGVSDLVKVYPTMIRPAVEYASVVYHSLIPGYLSDQLESVQKHAMKIVYGWEVDYMGLLDRGIITSLKNRREEAVKKFALKSEKDDRFREKWFNRRDTMERETRPGVRNNYEERRCNTERDKKNPVYQMTRVLNEHYRLC